MPALIGPAGLRILATEARFDDFVCMDGGDFEVFYLRHVLGIDPSKADTE